jgi:hypothetical protein
MTLETKLPSALALGWLMLASSAAADLRMGALGVECLPRKPAGDARWWSFREGVDGVRGKCWYPGRPGKSKYDLHWARRPSAVERPEAAVLTAPSAPGAPSTEILPEPVQQPTEPTFNQRWNDILSDLAMPVTRWRAPLKDQHRFGE